MNRLILFAFLGLAVWLIRQDCARRPGVSTAIWIPTLWVGVLASRPVSTWLGAGDAVDTLEGSPIDRLFFLAMIGAAVVVLAQRRLDWGCLVSRNWPIFLYYGYFLVSVLWADSTMASAKRWFKDFGNVLVALVILSEADPLQALRAVFVRVGILLLPLSVIFIRYFPDLGRRYSIHSGEMEATGVTFQKNSLGAMVVVCCLIVVWEWLERSAGEEPALKRAGRLLNVGLLVIGVWLLRQCDSKTSALVLALGSFVLFAARLPWLQDRIGALSVFALAVGLTYYILDASLGLTQWIVASLGRDMTFTGRTDVWEVLLGLKTDPLLGTGFCSFWSDARYQSKLPEWVAFSAHNGYLETYIDGGWLGVTVLLVLLVVVAARNNAQLRMRDPSSLLGFAVLLVALIGNASESHYGRMTPVWFLFLLTALDGSSVREVCGAAWDMSADGADEVHHHQPTVEFGTDGLRSV